MTHKWFAAVLALALVATLTPDLSEAKRLGGGKPIGMQRQMPAKPAPQNTPAQPAQPGTPGQTAPAVNPATAGAAAAAAAPAKRSWMGPLAGLAAGLGLAALASHFGFGQGLANFMMIALLAVAAFFVIRLIMSRLGGGRQREALAGAGAGAAAPSWTTPANPTTPVTPMPLQRSAGPAAGDNVSVTGVPLAPMVASAAAAATAASGAVDPVATGPTLPEGFDLPAFERAAKMIFIRLQAANDAGDLEDLREFTTPEMFAATRLEIQERQGAVQRTDVEKVDAQLIDFAQEPTRQVASVRLHGLVREDKNLPTEAFDEIWHLVKPADGSHSWAIAGIQQPA